MKSGKLALHHSCVILALWAGAESCWNVHFSSAKWSWAQGSTTASRIWDRYTSLSILTPWSRKTRGVLPLAQILPQTKTDGGTWRCYTTEDIPGACADQILSFWRLCDCSTLNNFSSEKMIFSQHVPAVWCWSWRHRWRRTCLFSCVRNCPFCSLYGFSPSSFFVIWRTDSREKPISLAIFLLETNVFLCICFLLSGDSGKCL